MSAQKESMVGKYVSEAIVHEDQITIRFYTPDLFAFESHCSNWYCTLCSEITNGQTNVLNLDSFILYCRGALRVMMHCVNHHIYRRGGAETESIGKLTNLTFGTSEVPRWLLDICREYARPMAKGMTLYVPYINKENCLTKGTAPNLPGFGIGVSQSYQCGIILSKVMKDVGEGGTRQMIEEDVTISPLCISDGIYTFVEADTASFRKSAYYYIQSFRNGCDAPELTMRGPVANPAAVDWNPEREVAGNIPIALVDNVPVPAMIPPPGGFNAMQVYQAILDNVDVLSNDPANPRPRVFLWYRMDAAGNDGRPVQYNAWFTRVNQPPPSLPPPDTRAVQVRAMTTVTSRFPSEEMRSKTPPQNSVRQDKLPNSDTDKKQGKSGRTPKHKQKKRDGDKP